MTPKTPMSDNEIRLAIATAMGWVWYRIPSHPSQGLSRLRGLFLPAIHEYEGQSEKWLVRADGTESICNMDYMAREGHVPDFPNDLNAIAEARKTLTEDEQESYAHELSQIVPQRLNCGPIDGTMDAPGDDIMCHREYDLIDASARQHCEAFLKVKGLKP